MSIFGRDLNYFLNCSHMVSFQQGAQLLGITQASLSIAIKRLEEELGFSVFDRTSKGVVLTPKGKLLVALAQKSKSQFEYQLLHNIKRQHRDELKVGLQQDFFQLYFLRGHRKSIATWPKLKVFVGANLQMQRAVEDRELDFAIVSWPNDPVLELSFVKLDPITIKVVGLKAKFPNLPQAKSLDDLKGYPWVTTTTPLLSWSHTLDNHFAGMVVLNEEDVTRSIIKGIAIGETPLECFTSDQVKKLIVAPIPSRFPHAHYYALYRKDASDELKNTLQIFLNITHHKR